MKEDNPGVLPPSVAWFRNLCYSSLIMTDYPHEKLVKELGDEMKKERAKISGSDISDLPHLIERALTLRAALQDVQASSAGEVPQSAYALQLIRSSEAATREYKRGKKHDISVPAESIRDHSTRDIITLLHAHPPYDTAAYPPLIRATIRNAASGRMTGLAAFEQDIAHADVSDHVSAFLWGERIGHAAHEKVITWLNNLLTPDLKISAGASPEDFWRLDIIGDDAAGAKVKDGINFFHGFAERIDEHTRESARALYSDQWPRALSLWRAFMYMPGKLTPTLRRIRREGVAALELKNLSEAERQLALGIEESPASFPESAKKYAREHLPPTPTQEIVKDKKQPSPLEQRLEDTLAYLAPYVGATFITKGGGQVRIGEIGLGIRYTQRGMRPGVKIEYLKKDPHSPLTGGMVVARSEILLPSVVIEKMKDWQLSATNPH